MNKNKIKGLFITHDMGNYGASRSLRLLLGNYEGISIDLICKKTIVEKNTSVQDIRRRFGPFINNILQLHLPYDFCFAYKPHNSLRILLFKLANSLLSWFSRKKLYAFIKQGNYDFIHLNSLVLHPVIKPEYPFFIHVREIYDGTNSKALVNIGKAKGVIFIDAATKEPFESIALKNSIVLNNPCDMTSLAEFIKKEDEWPEPGFEKRSIFSIIGTVSEKKGVGFVIQTFMKLKNDNARLLIVGSGNKSGDRFYENCIKNSEKDKRIFFLGEIEDMRRIYAVTDYVLRGEEYQCIGRTIYEGLYAGSSVIVPAHEEQIKQMFEYDKFKSHIYSYPPRSNGALLALFEQLSRKKVTERSFYSNVHEYVREFHRFVTKFCDD